MTTRDELQRAAVEDAALMDSLTRAFADELADVLTLLEAQIRKLLRTLQTDQTGRIVATSQNLARAVQLRADILALLESAGYRKLVADAVDEPLDRLARQILESTKAPLTTFDLDALVAMKEIRLAELLQVGEDIAIQLWRVVVDGVTGVRPVGDLIDDIADLMDISERHARVIYDTAVSIYSRQVGQIGSTGEPDERFTYVGPNDSKTREFCEELVGDIHTRDEIDAMDNGQLPNVMLTGGGFNCRHQWRRVTPFDDALAAQQDEE